MNHRLAAGFLALSFAAAATASAQDKPNILVIWGDDIGVHNISAYNHGIMGYQTPEHRPHRQGRRAVHRLPTPSRAAPRAARRSSSASTRSAPVC